MIPQTTPTEAKEMLDNDPNAIYLDVRTEGEFAQGHAPGAINVPVIFFGGGAPQPNEDFLAVVEKVVPKSTKVLCGCKAGGRSQRAAAMLQRAGYADVVNIDGGFIGRPDPATGEIVVPGWSMCDLPVETDVTDANGYAGLRKRAGSD